MENGQIFETFQDSQLNFLEKSQKKVSSGSFEENLVLMMLIGNELLRAFFRAFKHSTLFSSVFELKASKKFSF